MWFNRVFWGSLCLFACFVFAASSKCSSGLQGTAKVVCYYEGRKPVEDVEVCGCTHLVYTGDKRGEELENMSKKLQESQAKMKFLLRISGKEKDLDETLKSSSIHGIDLHEAHAELNRTRITKTVESLRTLLGSESIFMLSLPAQSELLAKYYDLKSLIKPINIFGVETHFLGEAQNETFHPSRLSGVWDMMNTDSIVDLTIGLGVPAAKIVVTAPAQGFHFSLSNSSLSTPGSPAQGDPRRLSQKQLCEEMGSGKWTLERDQDLSAPYAFKDEKWIAFEDTSSLDVKSKYSRIRGLAGLGLVTVDEDGETSCGPSLLHSIVKGLNTQARAPRGAVLGYLENEILSVPRSNRLVDSIQLSPYRISRVVDSDGVIHAIREDTRTEFECQRQGYFVHPRSCNRFYRCVKFDQLSDEFTVFEFDCPAGLAFDSRYEVCVWPGSLDKGQACPGSSEIAPVPPTRFVCPEKPGYYADPANCRWFFACLDHGKAPLSAYEFRCPFGLGFDESRLICDWPWLVPGCGNLGQYESRAHGHSASILTGSSAFIGSSADSVNVAAHRSLVSGASTSNLLGIQSGYGSQYNTAPQEYATVDYDGSSLHSGGQGFDANGDEDAGQIYHTGHVGVVASPDYISGSELLSDFKEGGASVGSGAYGSKSGSSGVYVQGGQGLGSSKSGSSGVYVQGGQGLGNSKSSSSGVYVQGGQGLGSSKSSSSGVYVQGGQGLGSSTFYGNSQGGQSGYSGINSNLNQGAYVDHGASNQQVYYSQGDSNTGGAYSNQGSLSGQQIYLGQGIQSQPQGALNAGGILLNQKALSGQSSLYGNAYSGGLSRTGGSSSSFNLGVKSGGAGLAAYYNDDSGEYKHDYSGEYRHDYSGESSEKAVPYQHVDIAAEGYLHQDGLVVPYQHESDIYNYAGSYDKGAVSSQSYQSSGAYANDKSGAYNNDNSGDYVSGSAQLSGYSGAGLGSQGNVYVNQISSNGYKDATYSGGSKLYSGFATTGAAHTLTAGAINSGLVGRTTLVDAELLRQNAYSGSLGASQSYGNAGSLQSYGNTGSLQSYGNAGSLESYGNTGSLQSYGNPGSSYSNQHFSTVTSGPVVSYEQPASVSSQSYAGQSYSSLKTGGNAYTISKPTISVTPTPIVSQQQHISVSPLPQISTYRPHFVSSQPKSEITQVFGYQKPSVSYVQPIVTVSSTPKPYYEQVEVKQPAISITSYNKPSVNLQQTYHNQDEYQTYKPLPSIATVTQSPIYYETQGYVSSTPKVSIVSYQKPTVTEYKNPLVSYESVTPVPTVPTVQAYVKQPAFSHQSTVSTFVKPSVSTYDFAEQKQTYQPIVQQNNLVHQVDQKYIQPVVQQAYVTKPTQQVYVQQQYVQKSSQPAVSHQVFQQTGSKQQEYVANQYVQPSVQTFSTPEYYSSKVEVQPIVVSSTPVPIKISQPVTYETSKIVTPIVSSTPSYVSYKQEYTAPQDTYSFQQQYVSPKVTYSQPAYVSSTLAPVEYKQQSIVQTYQTPQVTPVVSSTIAPVTYKPKTFVEYIAPQKVQESYQAQYVQPQVTYSQPAYVSSTPSSVNYQQQDIVQVYDSPKLATVAPSSTPSYVEYKKPTVQYNAPQLSYSYSSQNYVAPKVEYSQPAIVSSTPSTVKFEQQYNYQVPNVQTYQESSKLYSSKIVQPVKVSTPVPFVYQKQEEYRAPQLVEKFEISSNYNNDYSQQSYVSSTPKVPSYEPQQYVDVQDYQAPKVQYQSTTYRPSTVDYTQVKYTPTFKPVISSTTASVYKGPEYLPPINEVKTIYQQPSVNIKYPTEITAKYVSTPAPTYQAAISFNTNPIQDFAFNKISVTPKPSVAYESKQEYYQQSYQPIITTPKPVITYSKPTVTVDYTNQNQGNQVNLLGFGTVGPDAGIVSSNYASSTEDNYYDVVTPSTQRIVKIQKASTPSYVPVTQRIVEFTPPVVRKSRPKVAIVTKVNDYNPLIIRKLGAVCSCRSNVLRLRQPKPEPQSQEYDVEYDYQVPINGDYDDEWTYKFNGNNNAYTPSSAPIKSANPTVLPSYAPARSTTPVVRKPNIVVSSTLSPIIVNDESNNDDINIRPAIKSTFNPIVVTEKENYQSIPTAATILASTKSPSRGRLVRVKSRPMAVTVAPTIATVLVPEKQYSEDSESYEDDGEYNNYSSSGRRFNDESLRGVECKREGLFRHPKNCNKFYSCRWDCSKNKYMLHEFKCPIQLSFDPSMGACNWPSQGPACQGNTLLPSGF